MTKRTKLKTMFIMLAGAGGLALGVSEPVQAQCPVDSVAVGPLCVDKYEASVWSTTNPRLIRQIKNGNATQVLLDAAGATQHGTGLANTCDYESSDLAIGSCDINGAGCVNYYAVSIPNVFPSECVNWFRAAAICRNSGKRLLTNQEWQVAALGTPDPNTDNGTTDCNIGDGSGSGSVALTGDRDNCKSDVGAFDMVGNLVEIVAEWGEIAEAGGTWDQLLQGNFFGDITHVGGDGIGPIDPDTNNPAWSGQPGSTGRGGGYASSSGGTGVQAGAYAIDQNGAPSSIGSGVGAGFRCARPASP